MTRLENPPVKIPRFDVVSCIACLCVVNVSAGQNLVVDETATVITVAQGSRVVVTYNKVSPPAPSGIDAIYERSGFLHPINTPQGRKVTQMFPVDHPHQHGVFSAWVKTTYKDRSIDFWNAAKALGGVRHERVITKHHDPDRAGFEVELTHFAAGEEPIDILRERWKVTVLATDGTYHCFDVESTQEAVTDDPLIVSKYHYGGMALRGRTRWLTNDDRDARSNEEVPREPSNFLNDLGSDRIQGNHEHARWVALTGEIDGQPTTIAVMCHAHNFRAPQAARIHPTKPYFCFAPCVDGSFQIDRNHPVKARYRYLITDGTPDAAWLTQQWETWCGN